MRTAKLPKPIKSKNPVVILLAVIKAIKEEPKRYDQGTWHETIGGPAPGIIPRDDADFPQCGTICCVAGWVNELTGKRGLEYYEHEDMAMDALGLNAVEAYELFDSEPNGMLPREEVTPEKHAADGIKHIKQFVLKKWGKQL